MIIKILGLEKLMSEFTNTADINMMPAIKTAARRVQNSAKSLSPVDTGILKGSIRVRNLPKLQSAIVYTNVEYAPYQEFGTVKMSPQPFLTPALNINRVGISQAFKKYFRDQLAITVKGGKPTQDKGATEGENTEVRAQSKAPKRRTRVNGGYRISEGGKVTKGSFIKFKRK
jgi:HK97 gp10 family phage protein